jgi:excisionase family DNA binding protein
VNTLTEISDELTVREAAELLGVTSTTIYDLVKAEKLIPSRVEQKIKKVKRYFHRADVERLRAPDQQ